ncbi:MAG TPA: acyl-CoA thioesterase domain-containing protein [Acidimicrobiales bacterium]
MPEPDDPASLDSLDSLLRALVLEPAGTDRFVMTSESPPRFPQVFGGQQVAQALLAGAATTEGLAPLSIHAYFADRGSPERAIEVSVDRVRDGRTLAIRRVTLAQGERTLLTAIAAFHDNPTEPEHVPPAPTVPPPDELPTLQDWARGAPAERDQSARIWTDNPPPLDVRIGEPHAFLGGPQATTRRSHWLRLPRPVGDDALLHSVLLTYASDYFLLDMGVRAHPDPQGWLGVNGISLDHTVWLHRPTRFDRWHLYTQDTIALAGHRGLVQGTLHDDEGHLVATVAQDCLLVPMTTS